MPTFAGRLLLRDTAPEGWLTVEAGRIAAWGKGAPPDDAEVLATGWIVPAPVNAHTHVADACLRSIPGKPIAVADLVGPGGWKHRHLAAATPAAIEAGIRAYASEMAAIGTQAFVDFREGGLPGARLLAGLRGDLPAAPIILGRPLRNDYQEAEAEELLEVVDGVGLSALRDFAKPRDVHAWADACRDAAKPFALHASEAVREAMDAVLALEPSFLVHATQATASDLDAVAQQGVPVVVCPRSNAYHGLRSPLARMREAGVTVALGTDNGMLQDGNLLRDASLAASWDPACDEADILRMMTWHARDVAGLPTAPPARGAAADWIVLPETPLASLHPAAGKPGFVVPRSGA